MNPRSLALLCVALLLSSCSEFAPQPPPPEVVTLPPMTTSVPAESTEDFVNPERGFYKGLNLLSSTAAISATNARTAGFSLVIGLVKLDAYRAKPLDAAFLSQLDNGLKGARTGGVKVILRFMYNSDGTADAPLSVILNHIKQVTPLVRANADVIYAWQGGFIGGWGEWHGSTNGLDNDTSRKAIVNAMLVALPTNRAVQLRRPSFAESLYPAGSAGHDRVGIHNDCFLASETDMGTYTRPVEPWLTLAEIVGRRRPIGGETCKLNPPRSSCAVAQKEMRQLHYTYMNSQYHMGVLDGWKAEGCYSAVSLDLGYRFVLTRTSWSTRNVPGGVAYIQFDVKNRGYASLMNARPAYLVLTKGEVKRVVKLRTDPRNWAAGVTTTVTEKLRLGQGIEPGEWTATLWLPDAAPALKDDARYSVRFANTNATAASIVLADMVVTALTPEQKAAMDFITL